MLVVVVLVVAAPWPPCCPHPSPLPPSGRGDGCCGRGHFCDEGVGCCSAGVLFEARITLIFADGL